MSKQPPKPNASTSVEEPQPASITTELPVVTLGAAHVKPKPEAESACDPDELAPERAPKQRVLLGRIHPSWIFYPIYTLIVLSGGLAANVALDTGEWSFGVVVVAWTLVFLWNWMYVVAWTYQRRWLKLCTLGALICIEAGLAFACFDRSQPQWALQKTLIERGELDSLRLSAGMLVLCLVLLLIHLLYFGRGYRAKASAALSAPPEPTP